MNSSDRPAVGFIGLGDQGLPMATAIAGAGYRLNVWARRPASLEALGDTPHTAHATLAGLAAASDIAALCVSTDEDVLRLAAGLLPHLRPGSLLVNHGTGTPRNAMRLAGLSAGGGVETLDAPVSGGRPAAEARTLTVLAGGTAAAARRAEPVSRSFARHVVHLGGTGSGQLAKLFNNTLLMMNQASIADILGRPGRGHRGDRTRAFRNPAPPRSHRATEPGGSPVTGTRDIDGQTADAQAVAQVRPSRCRPDGAEPRPVLAVLRLRCARRHPPRGYGAARRRDGSRLPRPCAVAAPGPSRRTGSGRMRRRCPVSAARPVVLHAARLYSWISPRRECQDRMLITGPRPDWVVSCPPATLRRGTAR